MIQYVSHSPLYEVQPANPIVRDIGHIWIVKPYSYLCPAELALTAEGIQHSVQKVGESSNYTAPSAYEYAYGLAFIWELEQPFINLEHDVAPWSGAIDELWSCPHPWCRFQYPVFPPPRMSDGIGCMKFGQEIVSNVKVDSWLDLAWWDLDGQVISAIKGEGYEVHTHNPSVAHVRRPNGMRPSEMKA
jgi:hypothetical protein